MKTIISQQFGQRVIAILEAKEWEPYSKHAVLKNFFVVAEWMDFHDGEKSNVEGKVTIALTRSFQDAELAFNRNCAIWEKMSDSDQISGIVHDAQFLRGRIKAEIERKEYNTDDLQTETALTNIELHIIMAREIGYDTWKKANLFAYLSIGTIVKTLI